MVQRQPEDLLQKYQINNFLFFLNQFIDIYRQFHPAPNNIHHSIFSILFQINLKFMTYVTFGYFN